MAGVSALIDFAGLDGTDASLAFGRPREVLAADRLDAVEPVLRAAQQRAQAGAWVVGMVSYEAAPAFDPALRVRVGSAIPLAWFAVFDAPLQDCEAGGDMDRAVTAAPLQLHADTDRAAYRDGFDRIHQGLERGAYYQVNQSLRLLGRHRGDPLALYRRLRATGPGRYCAYLDLGAHQLLSLSPELFFARRGSRLVAQPMKGTRPRGRHAQEDAALAAELAAAAKDRAENRMIVDLLRNDMSRLAEPGGVTVSDLFAVQQLPTVWQMTSTIDATLRSDVDLVDIFRAMFPCGSVTGAPKVAAMAAIAEFESSPRGAYCGAIGLLRPGGDAVFNVAIRTLCRQTDDGAIRVGLGSAIVWDSTADDEYAEVMLKGAFLQRAPRPRFGLIETLRVESGQALRLGRHLQRLAASARYFGWPVEPARWQAAIDAALAGPHPDPARLRLELASDGRLELMLQPMPTPPQRPSFALAPEPVDRDDIGLFHKTTQRQVYDRAAASAPDAFDVLLWNRDGELTEFTRGNLVLDLDGRRLTPALDCGLLDGCLRREWLEQGRIAEARLSVADLARASRVCFLNSLRGEIEVERAGSSGAPPTSPPTTKPACGGLCAGDD